MEQFTTFLQNLDATSILTCMALVAFAKNIVPPLPSDALMVFAGTLVGLGAVAMMPLVGSCALGSTAGFMLMFALGRHSESRLQGRERVWFVPMRFLSAIETLFQRYGYGVIAANRFLGVKRVAVAFFAGLSGLSAWKTSICALFSATAWSVALLYAGFALGAGWKIVMNYLALYGWVMFVGVLLVVVIVLYRQQRVERIERVKQIESHAADSPLAGS
jgi:membrane protein DedA with SNARE-associated domain